MLTSALARNTLSNYALAAISGLVGFLLTPYLFHTLRPENYAILIFALSAVAVMKYLELGLFTALVRSVSELAERREELELKRLVSSVFYLFLGLGILGTIFFFLLSPILARFFQMEGAASVPGHVVLSVLALSLLFELPSDALRAFLQGSQDLHLANAVDITVQLARAALTVLLLLTGFGLVSVAATFAATAALRLLGMGLACRRGRIPFRPKWNEVSAESLRQTGGFARSAFVEHNASYLFFQLDTFLVAKLLPLPNLALLAVVRRIPMALRDFSVQPFSAAYPWVSAAAARKERQALQKFLFLAARNILALTLPLAIALFVWAETVLRLWVGEEVLAGTAVFRIFLVFAVFAVLREVPLALFYGIGKIRFSVVSSVAVLLAGIAGGGWACARYGLAGLAIAFAGIQAVATLLLMDHALKVAEIGWPEWLKKAVAPVLLAALATIVWFALWYQFLPRGPASMSASVLLGALVFFGVFVRLVVGPEKLNWHIYARKLLAEID